MTAVQLMTQHGGWPMSVFLTPSLKPFFAGTYFPPDDRYGGQMPSFRRVLHGVIDAWQHRRQAIDEQAGRIASGVQSVSRIEPAEGEADAGVLRQAGATLRRAFDSAYGGFGSAPKFPHPMDLRLLLRLWQRFGDEDARQMACRTFDGMAQGGMYDHLGGGFHRYSTDRSWLVPHFEKMLYDNALLAVAYLEGYQATGNDRYRAVVEETLGYTLREMTSPEGPFYSTQDADSEGVEGKFYVWQAEEITTLLGKDLAGTFCAVYDVSADGNWEGHNILNRSRSDEQEAKMLNVPVPELRRRLAEGRDKLYQARSKRIWPERDDKVLTSWNALMISALARAAAVLDRPEFGLIAARAADFILERMRQPDGRLYRTWSAGTAPKLNAYLEDYAFLLEALVCLYEATFLPRWIAAALDLARVLFDQFWDAREGGFFYTGRDHEELIARTKDPHDSSIPSGNAMAVTALLRLFRLTQRTELQEKAVATLRAFTGLLSQAPHAAGQMLLALDFHLGPVQEVVVVDGENAEEVSQVWRALERPFRPRRVMAYRYEFMPAEAESLIPLLADKPRAERVTTYLCENFTCAAPLVGVEALAGKE
jgi:uncharacterized protein YyaL (SSP411 family)